MFLLSYRGQVSLPYKTAGRNPSFKVRRSGFSDLNLTVAAFRQLDRFLIFS
jgi:hypothetical protein